MIKQRDLLQILAQQRQEQIVITTMGSVGYWPEFSDSDKDFHYLPSSMGQAVPLGLGLCLAQPGVEVIVLMGDGSLLMNLGCLVTVAQFSVPLRIILVDNQLYEVTGGQAVAHAGRTNYALIAQGAGIPRVYTCTTLEQWQQLSVEALQGPGPVFIWCLVEGERGRTTPAPPRSMTEQIHRLQKSLGIST
ncbi:MAG: thiamine pyrophosphate-dependent enzyme [Gemmataceae bacterium]|nr:thiamine pyrophosphate-dependent enzyme [Gemmataceae bacterium]MCS7272302.1 thiamine pyrophosphate-dependent enzyme [Gemmataceae bacterium]MDW8244228.1 thiamine pyrophosphate-dependent enzyme [Thermogemmata sp.]